MQSAASELPTDLLNWFLYYMLPRAGFLFFNSKQSKENSITTVKQKKKKNRIKCPNVSKSLWAEWYVIGTRCLPWMNEIPLRAASAPNMDWGQGITVSSYL